MLTGNPKTMCAIVLHLR